MLPGAGNLVQKGEKREEGESREKKAGVDGGFFFLCDGADSSPALH